MLDGRVTRRTVLDVEVYDLAGTDGPRGRGEASIIGATLRPDREGVVVEIHGGRQLLVPTAVVKAAARIAGRVG